MTNVPSQPPGWYHAQGDPVGTQRYWDGAQWQGGPQPVAGAAGATPGGATMVGGAEVAEGWKRIVARMLDAVAWIFILGGVSLVFGIGVIASDNAGASFIVSMFASILSIALVIAYEVGCTVGLGATPGKLALGMKVRKDDGAEVDLNAAIMRMVPWGALGIIGIIPILGILTFIAYVVGAIAGTVMLFTDDRCQTPWDKVGKTIVVEA